MCSARGHCVTVLDVLIAEDVVCVVLSRCHRPVPTLPGALSIYSCGKGWILWWGWEWAQREVSYVSLGDALPVLLPG